MSIACIRITAYCLKDLTATWFASQLEMIGTGICSEWIEYDLNCTLLNRCHFCNNIRYLVAILVTLRFDFNKIRYSKRSSIIPRSRHRYMYIDLRIAYVLTEIIINQIINRIINQ